MEKLLITIKGGSSESTRQELLDEYNKSSKPQKDL
jgi:hypothetical protein